MMIQQHDILAYNESGFDSERYIALQKKAIEERVKATKGTLYLEIGGKFLSDSHAARVLPGFHADNKKTILQEKSKEATILFCMTAEDIISNRQLDSNGANYGEIVFGMLRDIEKELAQKPMLVINKCQKSTTDELLEAFIQEAKTKGYSLYRRYFIEGYPKAKEKIFGPHGFAEDEHIPIDTNLVFVTGAASNSGKMSTCFGQVFLDHQKNKESSYAKLELFPIWNLPLLHPVNLAYEAATADIGDYNVWDAFHKKAYGDDAVNYNREVDAFIILQHLAKEISQEGNLLREYQSPTDMGVNMSGFAITNDMLVAKAATDEIVRRKQWYQAMLERGEGKQEWIEHCNTLEEKARHYLRMKGRRC